jgi:hypothetical protein
MINRRPLASPLNYSIFDLISGPFLLLRLGYTATWVQLETVALMLVVSMLGRR